MKTLLAWLLPMLLTALGEVVDRWALGNTGAGGIVGALAGIWVALRIHPNGVNGPPKTAASRTLSVDAPAPDPEPRPTLDDQRSSG